MPETKSEDKKPKRRQPRPFGRTLWVWGSNVLAVFVWVSLAVGLVLGYHAVGLPSIDAAVIERRPNVTLVDTAGEELASLGDVYGPSVRLDELPPYVPAAV